MNPLLLVYFAAGLGTDYLVATYYLYLSSHQRAKASALAVAIDLFGFTITMFLVLGKNWTGAFCFALGTGLGTWLAMGRNK